MKNKRRREKFYLELYSILEKSKSTLGMDERVRTAGLRKLKTEVQEQCVKGSGSLGAERGDQ